MAEEGVTRRGMLKAAGAAVAASALGAIVEAEESIPEAQGRSMAGEPFARHERVRLGVIGTGGRGTGVMRDFMNVPGVEVVAICDVVPERATRAAGLVEKQSGKAPTRYTAGPRDYEKLCARDDLDLVLVATPWEWHVPMALEAVKNGHHVGLEVPAARTVKECWQLVDASERTRRHIVMLENCCYGYGELLVLGMVRAGLLGELTHGAGAYNHDLRGLLYDERSEGKWRREDHKLRDGNLYPTHGLGPVANYFKINRGDRFDHMVSMSSPSRALQEWRDENLPVTDPRRKETYRHGDQNTSLIKTASGRLITVEHNVVTPQPYDRINLVAGTKGIFRDYPARIYIDGQPGGESFTDLSGHKARFEHPLWSQQGERARQSGGHGGMDYIMCWRLIQCMREGLAPDMDVYDAAAWSVVGPLSEDSIRRGSSSVKFPDFTRGKWRQSRLFAGL